MCMCVCTRTQLEPICTFCLKREWMRGERKTTTIHSSFTKLRMKHNIIIQKRLIVKTNFFYSILACCCRSYCLLMSCCSSSSSFHFWDWKVCVCEGVMGDEEDDDDDVNGWCRFYIILFRILYKTRQQTSQHSLTHIESIQKDICFQLFTSRRRRPK